MGWHDEYTNEPWNAPHQRGGISASFIGDRVDDRPVHDQGNTGASVAYAHVDPDGDLRRKELAREGLGAQMSGMTEREQREAQAASFLARRLSVMATAMMAIPEVRLARGPVRTHGLKAAPPRAKLDVGRNQPCPCGSGRKFKACCLPKTEG